MSCQADIPPAFVKAIESNLCPGCGGAIMDDSSKDVMEELKIAMTQMPNADAQAIVGWLLSNYQLVKIGDALPTQFHNAKKAISPGQKLKIAKNKLQDKLKQNTQGPKLPPTFKTLVERINASDEEDEPGEELEYEEELEMEGYDDEMEEEDPYIEAQLNRRKFKSKAKKKANMMVNPNIGDEEFNSLDEAQLNSIMNKKFKKSSILEEQRLERLEKQQALSDGVLDGAFRRG